MELAAVRVAGFISYDRRIVAASVLIAMAAATVALWLSVAVRGTGGPIVTSAAIMAVAVCGMHYTGMAATHVHLVEDAPPVPGIDPLGLLLPIVIVTMATLIALVFSALQTATLEDFHAPDLRAPRMTGRASVPRSSAVGSHR